MEAKRISSDDYDAIMDSRPKRVNVWNYQPETAAQRVY